MNDELGDAMKGVDGEALMRRVSDAIDASLDGGMDMDFLSEETERIAEEFGLPSPFEHVKSQLGDGPVSYEEFEMQTSLRTAKLIGELIVKVSQLESVVHAFIYKFFVEASKGPHALSDWAADNEKGEE